jgi:V/A-type H+-transporting ATPase subunit D
MAKVKLTKGELKRQRDALKQYERFLPTLQLKKQQLQIEILRQVSALEEKEHHAQMKQKAVLSWAGLLADGFDLKEWVLPVAVTVNTKNIAGIDLPAFGGIKFRQQDYDLFSTPLWIDAAVEAFRSLNTLREEMRILRQEIQVLRQELRITTQRVNLFEKVKIPEAEEAIRLIKIYIGDQMTNAVGRSKIAKRKIEAYEEVSLAA